MAQRARRLRDRFVALKQEYAGQVQEAEIIQFCKDRMAAYKYPREVAFVPEIPKTATGKFLRRALRGGGCQQLAGRGIE